MAFEIHPPIGFARVGDGSEFLVAREREGAREIQIGGAGGETEVGSYKADDGIKPVAARFRVFDVPADGSAPTPVDLSGGVTIEWTVRLANRKQAVVRPAVPPAGSTLPQSIANPDPVTIDPGPRTIAGADASGERFDDGEFMGTVVPLGELRTDGAQNLLVLGGRGFASTPDGSSLTDFYSNDGWHDDTSDGPVTARVLDANGNVLGEAAPAWVVVGPPDYAPDIEGLVTLFDVVRDVGVQQLGHPLGTVSYTRDVWPMLQRTSMLQWVNVAPEWRAMNTDWAALGNDDPGARSVREDAAEAVRAGANVLSRFRLTTTQQSILSAYIDGDFDADWAGVPTPGAVTPEGLTRAALDSTVGQGFFPGIEAGIVMRNASIYTMPFGFRLDPTVVAAGDLTALMAVPWQADFLACNEDWWPSQRPNEVRTSAAAALTDDWARDIDDYQEMVDKFSKLGFVVEQPDGAGGIVYAEDQRAPDSEF